MKNLYEVSTTDELKARLAQLQPESQRQWGTMTVAQAVAHCADAMAWAVGETIPAPASFVQRLAGRILKPLVLGGDTPFRRNSPTSPDLIIRNDRNLEAERSRLCQMIDRFAAAGPGGCTTHPHSFFGKMNPTEWATLMYKHLDHHLRQFGV
ncbi:MAG: DUF1569 domain-containing protein [Terracidiphilus sp.]